MIAVARKISIVGDFSVGKTSVVERFVTNHFSERYLTTVGVKIDTKEVTVSEPHAEVKLIIWDVAGTHEFGAREFAYVRGSSGIVYVADGTRPETLDSVSRLREQINEKYGDLPSLLLVNKKDLTGSWKVKDDKLDALAGQHSGVYTTSAKTGDDVDTALTRMAGLVIAEDLRR